MTLGRNVDDIASGCFSISGHWGYISGTANTIIQGLSVLNIGRERLYTVAFNADKKEFVAIIHT